MYGPPWHIQVGQLSKLAAVTCALMPIQSLNHESRDMSFLARPAVILDDHSLRPTCRLKYAIESDCDGYTCSRTTETISDGLEYRNIVVLPKPPVHALLLVTDIDGTLIGDDNATARCTPSSRLSTYENGAMIRLNPRSSFLWNALASL